MTNNFSFGRIPQRVLEHLPTGRAAAYSNAIGTLIAENVSEELLQFARGNCSVESPWQSPSDLPLPSWLSEEDLYDCIVYWLPSDERTKKRLAMIPLEPPWVDALFGARR